MMNSAKYLNVLYDNGEEINLSDDTKEYLGKMLGFDWNRIVWDGTVRVPDLSLDEELRKDILKYVSQDRVSVEPDQRILHSVGKSSEEILSLMKGHIPTPVDIVIYPRENELEELIRSVSKLDVVFTVTGGRTSVTRGISGKGDKKTVCIDTSNMKEITVSGARATAGAGLTGKEIEDYLEKRGLTCGFFPESFRYSTLGGWISTKATGQESNSYGDIENIVTGVKVARMGSVISEQNLPRNSSGPSPLSLVLGAEGQNGIIMSANLRIFPKPKRRFFSTIFFRSFSDAVSKLSKMDSYPTVLRVMDETETSISLLEISRKTRDRLKRYLRFRGIVDGSMGIVVNNNSRWGRIAGTVSVGGSGARTWYDSRFLRPRMGNSLWKRGIISDTVETSAFWDSIMKIHSETSAVFHKVVRENQGSGIIMAHLSHQYNEGSCLYFTYLLNSEKQEELLKLVREAVIGTIIENGGSISHHHGLGGSLGRYLNSNIRELLFSIRDENMVWKWT